MLARLKRERRSSSPRSLDLTKLEKNRRRGFGLQVSGERVRHHCHVTMTVALLFRKQ